MFRVLFYKTINEGSNLSMATFDTFCEARKEFEDSVKTAYQYLYSLMEKENKLSETYRFNVTENRWVCADKNDPQKLRIEIKIENI